MLETDNFYFIEFISNSGLLKKFYLFLVYVVRITKFKIYIEVSIYNKRMGFFATVQHNYERFTWSHCQVASWLEHLIIMIVMKFAPEIARHNLRCVCCDTLFHELFHVIKLSVDSRGTPVICVKVQDIIILYRQTHDKLQ